jgi:hypothetical protein
MAVTVLGLYARVFQWRGKGAYFEGVMEMPENHAWTNNHTMGKLTIFFCRPRDAKPAPDWGKTLD